MGSAAIVTGTEIEDRAAIIKQYCKTGRPVFLEREPDNKFDANAIAVYFMVQAEEEKLWIHRYEEIVKCKIGYIKSTAAKSLARKIDHGLVINAHVTSFDLYYENEPRVSLQLNY